MLRPVCSSYEEEIIFQFSLLIGQLSRCTWPEEGKSTFFNNICWMACEATCECGVGGRGFSSSNFLQCLKLHILQQGLNPKPNQLAQANVMNIVTASHPEKLITSMYCSTVCGIAHCQVIQWSIDSRFNSTETMVFHQLHIFKSLIPMTVKD